APNGYGQGGAQPASTTSEAMVNGAAIPRQQSSNDQQPTTKDHPERAPAEIVNRGRYESQDLKSAYADTSSGCAAGAVAAWASLCVFTSHTNPSFWQIQITYQLVSTSYQRRPWRAE